MTGRALRDLGFLASALLTGTIAFGLLLAGWLTVGLLSITPLVVPALIAFAWCVRLLTVGDARLVRGLLGAPSEVPPRAKAPGFWGSGLAVLSDPGFWRSQGWLLARTVVGWPLAVGVVSLLAAGLEFVVAPIVYRWIPQHGGTHGIDLGFWQADTLPKALLLVPAGLVVLAVTVLLVRVLAEAWRRLAARLLTGETGPAGRPARRRALVVHAMLFGVLSLVFVTIWAITGASTFWPKWPILALGAVLAFHGWVEEVEERPELRRRRWFALQLGGSAVLELFLIGVWACAGGGYFWPVWALLGLVVAAALHWAALLFRRVERLEETRAGAVDVQDADLHRIERDLHDGAQARLVALGMSLGRAEQKLEGDPEGAAELVAEARVGVEAALRELRDLARGIRPPVLTDRGLAAAVGSLAAGSPLDVEVDAHVEPRPASTVETAAYFVVSEALTNAAKHARATRADVRLERRGDVLDVEVRDDGLGGADPAGGGLTGLRRRVEALDGTLTVASPAGGPTVVRAELPCAS
jgi:signal transduction histidine kinase